MDQEVNSTVTDGNQTPEGGDKTFTQEQVNAIVQDRLAKEKGRQDGTQAKLAEREQELARRELLFEARETLAGMGLPAELTEAIRTDTPEVMRASIAMLAKYIKGNVGKPTGFPPVEKRDRRIADSGDPIREGMGLNMRE